MKNVITYDKSGRALVANITVYDKYGTKYLMFYVSVYEGEVLVQVGYPQPTGNKYFDEWRELYHGMELKDIPNTVLEQIYKKYEVVYKERKPISRSVFNTLEEICRMK